MLGRKSTNKEPAAAGLFPLRFLVWGSAFCLFVPLVFLFAIHLPALQEQLIGKLIREVERATPLQVRLGSYRLRPFSRLELLNLNISASGKELLVCDQASLVYRISTTWPYVHATELLLEKAVLNLERDTQGNWLLPRNRNADKHFPGRVHPDWVRIPLPQVRIVSGTVTAHQEGKPVLTLRNVNGTLSFRVVEEKEGPRLIIEMGGLSQERSAREPQGGDSAGSKGLKPSNLSYLTIDGSSQVAGRGTVDLFPDGEVDVEVWLDPVSRSLFPALAEQVGELKELTGYVRARRQGGAWTVDHDWNTNLGTARGRATVGWENAAEGTSGTKTVRWSGRFENLAVPPVASPGPGGLFGDIEVEARGRDLSDMEIRVKGHLDPSNWGDQRIQTGILSGSYAGGVASLEAVEVRSSLGNFSARLWADVRGAWDPHHAGKAGVDLQVERGALDKVLPGAKQRAGGSVKAEGRYSPGRFRDWKDWQARVEGTLNLPDFFSLKASGTYENALLRFDYELEAPEIGKVSALVPSWEGKGRISSRGSFRGTWPDLVWEGSVSSPRLEYGPLVADQVAVNGKGKVLGRDGHRKAALKARGWSLHGNKMGAVQADLEQQDGSCRFEIKGEQLWQGTSARLAGLLENLWLPTRTLVLKPSRVNWKDQAGSVEGRIEFSGDRIQIHSLTIQQNRQKIQLTGAFAPDARADLTLNLDSVQVAPWLRFLDKNPVEAGSLGGQIRLTGRVEQPEATLNLQITNVTLNPEVFRDKSSGEALNRGTGRDTRGQGSQTVEKILVTGNFSRDALQVKADLQAAAFSAPAVVTARIPLRFSLDPPRLDIAKTDEWRSTLRVTGFSADRILPYVEDLSKVGGRIDGEVEGGGSWSQPFLKGSGTLQDGDFTVKAWPHPVEKLRGDWSLDEKFIHIRSAEGQLLGGRVEVKGRVRFPSFRVAELEATGENLGVTELYGIRGRVSGKARLSELSENPELTADLRFSKAEMQLGDLETDIARNIQIVGGDEQETLVEVQSRSRKKPNYFHRMKMELHLGLPDSGSWVRGKGLDAEINGSMTIEKGPHGPVRLLGSFYALRGTYNFQGNQLKVVEGELIFRGSPEPDPVLKIICQKQVKDVTVQVQVTGPVSQPKLALSSVPSMNQVDVLSYLLFGHPAGELNTKQQFQLQDRAASWIGSQTSHVLKDVFGNNPWTPDTLHYRSSDDRKEGAVVEIGKYVTPDLYVTYGKGIRGETENQVQVEYRLNRHLSVQTQVGGAEQSGVDVFWRYDFGK